MSTENDRIRRELGMDMIEAERKQGVKQPAPKPVKKPEPPPEPEKVVTILDEGDQP